MANEFKHKDPGSELTQAEYISACGDGHIFACQATGDLIYADSSTVLKKLARGSTTQMLQIASCKPAWTSTPSLGTTSWCNMNHAHGAGNSGGTVCANVLAGTTLKSCVVTSSLTTVGALNSGSISCGFGAIDNGSSAITTTGLISGGSLDIDNVLINGTTIGHTCDTDLMTVGNACLTIKGAVTVGVDDTGHDVKFFGAAAGAYMEWDESANLLEVRGATAAGPGHLKLTTGEATVVACDVLGKIEFQAPAEADCSADARLIGASIAAVAQGTFSNTVNSTDLIFYTGHSEAATEKFRFTSQGEIGIGGANYGTDGQVLTSGGAGAAPAWEDAAGGAGGACAVQVNDCVAVALGTGSDSKLYYDGTDTHLDLLVVGSGDFVIAQAACHPSPDPGQVHLWAGNAGCVTATTTTQLTIEDNTNTGISILTPAACFGAIYFGSPGSGCNITGGLIYNHGACRFCVRVEKNNVHAMTATSIQAASGCASTPGFAFKSDVDTGSFLVSAGNIGWAISGSEKMRLNSNGGLFVNETADGTSGAGSIVTNQGTADDPIFILKSCDIAHGMTDQMENDTYYNLWKAHSCHGGIMHEAASEGCIVVNHQLYGSSDNSTRSTSGNGTWQMLAYARSGTGVAAKANGSNLFALKDAGDTRFIVDVCGNVYYDGSTNASNWDEHCDVSLLTATRAITMPEGADFKHKFSSFIDEYACALEATGVVTLNRDTDSIPFVNTKALNGLIIDSIRQVHDRVIGLETQLKALKGGCP